MRNLFYSLTIMNIDLNLHNYSKQDIERLFGLTSGYSSDEIHQREKDLATRLTKTQANTTLKDDILHFLQSAKEKLLGETINPVYRTEVKRLLCIDSMFRPRYNTTQSHDFMYFMPDYIKNVMSLNILSVELPNAWYQFSEDNCNSTFYLTYGANPTTTFVIPDGNYTYDSIIKILNVLFQSCSGYTMDVTAVMNPFTKKIMFQSDSNTEFTLTFQHADDAIRKTCGINLGFMKSSYSVNGSVEAEVMFGSNIDHYVFIDVDDFQRNFLANAVVSVTTSPLGIVSYLGNTIMAKIPLSSESHTLFNNGADLLFKTRTYFGPVNLEKLHLRLLNRYGTPFSLNHSNYSMSIEITELY